MFALVILIVFSLCFLTVLMSLICSKKYRNTMIIYLNLLSQSLSTTPTRPPIQQSASKVTPIFAEASFESSNPLMKTFALRPLTNPYRCQPTALWMNQVKLNWPQGMNKNINSAYRTKFKEKKSKSVNRNSVIHDWFLVVISMLKQW